MDPLNNDNQTLQGQSVNVPIPTTKHEIIVRQIATQDDTVLQNAEQVAEDHDVDPGVAPEMSSVQKGFQYVVS